MKKYLASLFIVAAIAATCGLALDATYVQSEVSIPYTPTADVAAGDVLVLTNGLVAVANNAISSNKLGSVMLRGVFDVAKDTSTTYVGQLIYWDEDGDQYGNATTGTGAATTTPTANSWLGFATEVTGATDDSVKVMLYPLGNQDATDWDVTGNSTLAGTLAVTGVATFTAESVHNLGIDADYITTDVSAGIDTKTEGTLLVGAATANKVEIADAAILTDIQGTLSVDQAAVFDSTVTITGVATLTAAPKLVTTNAAGAITLTMTNAPTAADAGKATPAYIRITIGATSYVIPAWPLSE